MSKSGFDKKKEALWTKQQQERSDMVKHHQAVKDNFPDTLPKSIIDQQKAESWELTNKHNQELKELFNERFGFLKDNFSDDKEAITKGKSKEDKNKDPEKGK